MKRVLLITPYYDPFIVGGAEISTQLIAEGINYETLVLTAGEKDGERELNGVRILEVKRSRLSNIWKKVLEGEELNSIDTIALNIYNMIPIRKWVNSYKRILYKEKIDVVILNTNIDALGRASIWKSICKQNVPSILVLRDPILLRKKLLGVDVSRIFVYAIKRQIKYIDSFAAPSKYMIDLYKSGGLFKDSNYIVPNAVDNVFIPCKYEKKKNVVLYAGSIRTEKGIRTLVDSFEYNDLANNVKLKLFGSGELEDYCRSKKYVDCQGWIDRHTLYYEMQLAKIVVLPSEYPEAFGRILIEAVSQGTLVIGSDSGGIPEILDSDYRYMYKSGDKKALANLINRIICLPEHDYITEVENLQNKFRRYTKAVYIENWTNTIDSAIHLLGRKT